MKTFRCCLAALLLAGFQLPALALPETGRALIYISPDDYRHPVRLWHFYYDYWFSQGDLLEPVALETMNPAFSGTTMCRSNKAADVLIWLRPRMFYNPHMTRYYGSIVALAYSGSGTHLGTYQAKVERHGFLDILPGAQVSAIYKTAMQDVVSQLRADAAVQKLMAEGLPEKETAMPCGMVTITPIKQ